MSDHPDATTILIQRLYDADQERHAVLYSLCECGHAVHWHQDFWWRCLRCACRAFEVTPAHRVDAPAARGEDSAPERETP